MTPDAPEAPHAPAQTVHVSVLSAEVLAGLAPQPGGVFVDGTLGGGGHTALLLERTAPDGRVLAIDADAQAIARAQTRLAEPLASGRLLLRQGNFAGLATLAREAGLAPVDGVLLDLGLSSDQLADRARGFSFANATANRARGFSFANATAEGGATLDMRFDADPANERPSAADLLNTRDAEEIADILWRYGEERRSRAIARRVVEARQRAPIRRADEFARLVASVVYGRPGGVHPATRSFQALRIAVNDELGSLEAALPAALDILRPGGRIAVISFHSLEDRIVKRFFQAEERGCVCPPELPACVCGRTPRLRIITRHPITAGEAELAANPRARSAKLRVAERVSGDGAGA
ncbi:MAG TPA: 16S rRNA (cytosine(1402)-N(4))-methyltransferase RsmH [Ktedonobacterales bacterium]|nr:16S rRNA (cytosine(1402)-N(4))-methyltransferase RsmH [Ktedonobacterales bacterium]